VALRAKKTIQTTHTLAQYLRPSGGIDPSIKIATRSITFLGVKNESANTAHMTALIQAGKKRDACGFTDTIIPTISATPPATAREPCTPLLKYRLAAAWTRSARKNTTSSATAW
jgi:hypothetical protein